MGGCVLRHCGRMLVLTSIGTSKHIPWGCVVQTYDNYRLLYSSSIILATYGLLLLTSSS